MKNFSIIKLVILLHVLLQLIWHCVSLKALDYPLRYSKQFKEFKIRIAIIAFTEKLILFNRSE